MFHPQNPFDQTSTAAAPAAPPSPIPHFKTPDLALPDNLPHLPQNLQPKLPHLPGNLPHLPIPQLPGTPGQAPPASPVPVVSADPKKGLLNRLKSRKLPDIAKVKPPKVKVGKRTRLKLAVTKIRVKLRMGAKVPSTRGVTSAVPVEAPVAVPAAAPVSPRL